jgi:choline-sulfatase
MALRGLSLDKTTLKTAGTAERRLLEAMRLPEGVGADEFFAEHCPPLPPNFEPQRDEPEAIRWLLKHRSFRMRARTDYTELDWRLHRWAYHRLTEFVDRQIQVVLDALRDTGQEERTVVFFSSDHGDMDAAHRMEHKTALYDEAARIPFLVMDKANAPGGRVDTRHLVSNGLDLLPTLCDYAGIEGRADPRGRSLRPLIEGKAPGDWRETLGVESEIGRMVVGEACKYVRYDRGADQEQLLDLVKDPHETRHFTTDADHATVLTKLRRSFEEEWFPGV